MLIAAFIITAIAGMVIGIWLAARAAASPVPGINPVRLLAFTDVIKSRTIETYVKELGNAIDLKYPENPSLPVSSVVDFITEYTSGVLEDHASRR